MGQPKFPSSLPPQRHPEDELLLTPRTPKREQEAEKGLPMTPNRGFRNNSSLGLVCSWLGGWGRPA